MPVHIKNKQILTPMTETLDKYDSALEWLNNNGFNVNPTRYNAYRKQLVVMIESWGEQTFREIAEDKQCSSALVETQHLIEIKEKLESIKCDGFMETIQKTLKGQVHYSDEKKNASSPRDYAFELYMARYFQRSGYELSFDTIADFNAFNQVDSVFIECKRPRTEDAIGKNIEKALKQSKKRFKDNCTKHQKGLAAIDITSLLFPNNEILITEDIREHSRLAMLADQKTAPYFKSFFDSYGDDCISIITYSCIPFIDIKNEMYGIYDRCFSIPIYKPNTESEAVFFRLNQALQSGVGK
ncbi:hypothetical protein NI385_17930 [Vibrio parahaemolyticus]|uniref:hypothetical protein n=1 Tax=Vibrio alginolyticus TaxID=663 RepID=UPI00063DB619|nr:hypothetical protein [Vibrio alginolyticus]KLI69979.1 hypothetical protein AAW26_23165 [Vibrio alginolyticus]MDM4740928.1 hypothetical protein [Vibrio alginolyticus]MDM4761283.1 hypothetical protein [Vibrio alginolyticus]WMN77882.1 hypothetical protein NI385_17930 [Vibrio parahaemolyticus]